MKQELLERSLINKIRIIKNLYLKPSIIFLVVLGFLFSLKFIPVSEEIKRSIFIYKRYLLGLSSTSFRNISLFFIGIVIGSYSIVQSLLDEESLKVLTEADNKKISKYTYINIYFYSYVIILLLTIFFYGGIELLLNLDEKLNLIKKLEFDVEFLKSTFKWILFIQIAVIISIGYEFKIFIRNLYDIFKVTTYIKTTKMMSEREKIIFINNYLFNKHLINYFDLTLTQEAYTEMKKLIGKDFTLDEAVVYIKTVDI